MGCCNSFRAISGGIDLRHGLSMLPAEAPRTMQRFPTAVETGVSLQAALGPETRPVNLAYHMLLASGSLTIPADKVVLVL